MPSPIVKSKISLTPQGRNCGLAVFLSRQSVMAKHLALVGLPGSGKSTIGWQVRRAKAAGCLSMPTTPLKSAWAAASKIILPSTARPLFGRLSSRCWRTLLQAPQPTVIATGGGAVLKSENRVALREKAARCFTCTLHQRISPGGCVVILVRPLLQGVDALQRLQALQKVRGPLYREVAHYVLDTRANNPHPVAVKSACKWIWPACQVWQAFDRYAFKKSAVSAIFILRPGCV